MKGKSWWNKKDEQILKEFWGRVDINDLSKLFRGKRSAGSIKQKAQSLGLPPPGRQSCVDEDFAKTLRKRIKI